MEVREYVVADSNSGYAEREQDLLPDRPKTRAALHAEEVASFQWPLRSVEDVVRLLQTSHAAPTDIVGCEFSGAMR